MGLVNFDTLKASKELKNKGFNEEQAEAVINIIALSVNNDNLATKDELKQAVEQLNNKINDIEGKLTNKINDVEEKLTNKINDVEEKLTNKINDVESKLTNKINDVEGKLSNKIDFEILKLQNNLFKIIGGGFVATCGVMLAGMRMMLN